ncbi:hypothetical protein [Streptomyces hypolithicus]
MGRTETTRRRVLGVTGAAAVAALTGGCAGAPPTRGAEGAAAKAVSVRAETRLRKASAQARRALLAHYDAVAAAHPSTAELLQPMREAVARHADALRPPGRAADSGRAGGAKAPDGPAPQPPAVAAVRGAALRDLAAEERREADAHTAALMDAPGELARLLASVAAAAAAHAYLLTEGSGE